MLITLMLLPREITNTNFTTSWRLHICDKSKHKLIFVKTVVFLYQRHTFESAAPRHSVAVAHSINGAVLRNETNIGFQHVQRPTES
jgi:hypothetical protein